MGTIRLHTPTHFTDDETTTEYEANDIQHIVSVTGNEESDGTNFYLSSIPEKQFCIEPAVKVKEMVRANKEVKPTVLGNQYNFNANVKRSRKWVVERLLKVAEHCEKLNVIGVVFRQAVDDLCNSEREVAPTDEEIDTTIKRFVVENSRS